MTAVLDGEQKFKTIKRRQKQTQTENRYKKTLTMMLLVLAGIVLLMI
ncbi:MAG TPA: hypothetical protein VEC17_00940 [Candidatus Binatia bacterium]|nr:hypothetical protein [Candidatus Binatia bacterium]